MFSSEAKPMQDDSDKISHPVNGGHIIVPQLKESVEETLEGQNIVGFSSKIFKHPKGEEEKDLTKFPSERKTLRKQAKEAAKNAAAEAAQQIAYSFFQDEEIAKSITQSIMKKAKFKEKENPRENRLFHLAQNSAMNAARIAAEEAAYDVLKDEKEALKLVDSLKLHKYAQKENQNGGVALQPFPVVPKFKTLQDLKQNESRPIRIQIVPSHLNQIKEGIEVGGKAVDTSFKIADCLKKLIKLF